MVSVLLLGATSVEFARPAIDEEGEEVTQAARELPVALGTSTLLPRQALGAGGRMPPPPAADNNVKMRHSSSTRLPGLPAK